VCLVKDNLYCGFVFGEVSRFIYSVSFRRRPPINFVSAIDVSPLVWLPRDLYIYLAETGDVLSFAVSGKAIVPEFIGGANAHLNRDL